MNEWMNEWMNEFVLLAGGMQDYNYVKHGCLEITLEVSCCKYPPADRIAPLWRLNKQPMVHFLQNIYRGEDEASKR